MPARRTSASPSGLVRPARCPGCGGQGLRRKPLRQCRTAGRRGSRYRAVLEVQAGLPRLGRMDDPVALIPDEVRRLLGQDRVEVTRLGSARVLRGNSCVVKVGPPERIAREAFILGDLAPHLPLKTPRLIDAGQRWLVMTDLGDSEPP